MLKGYESKGIFSFLNLMFSRLPWFTKSQTSPVSGFDLSSEEQKIENSHMRLVFSLIKIWRVNYFT